MEIIYWDQKHFSFKAWNGIITTNSTRSPQVFVILWSITNFEVYLKGQAHN